ncbi:TonB-dependent receptor [Pseudomonas panipatensis]|uniref:Iron complex outermembrane recepter protein n=1 Tax=Pseudomonas panipatensis TaxID=428992 RepID=A0A1G8FSR4_9PSED|nr:TonB-dependent receptor [Pseudomonas panipatensis]SDH85163.1 iron complex outermembrane recepter protein [Pseudomonas panipatensis]SMP52394.1 iron complex outermembrane recepter protein [Pseudomonas panipatensis]
MNQQYRAHTREEFPRLSALTLAIAALVGGAQLPASAADGDSAKADDAAPTLNAVTVTATRREESLQKVPVAVSVISGEQLERDNRNNVSTIVSEVPSLNYRAGASNKDTSLFVRGVGTVTTSPGVEPSVSTVVDGVVYGRPGMATLDLLDLERIEVLRGPQGTLFGKNASAGVLNIVTKDAPDDSSGYVDYSHFGGGNENRTRFGIGGTLLPGKLKASFSALLGSYDGNVKNVYNGQEVNGYNRKGGRAKFELTPNDDLKVTLIADYMQADDDSPNGVITSTSSAAFAKALSPVVASSDNRRINTDYRSHVEDINKGLSAQVDWSLGDYTLTSISAWRGWDNTQYQDGDRLSQVSSAFPSSDDKGDLSYDQYSEEIRLASPKGEFLEYVTGLYYMHAKDDETYRRVLTSSSAVNSGVADFGTRSDSYSAFGESTLNFTPSFRGIAGLRYTHDELEYDHRRRSTSATAVTGIQPSTSSSGSTDEDGWSGRLGLQYDLNPNLTSYLTYSRGYKGPAYNVFFNMQPRDTQALKPETSNSWELGLKANALDNRLTANFALFHTVYDNYQANFYDTVAGQVVTRLINAGSVKTEGAEADLAWQATRRLKLSGSVAYTHARIESFNCPAGAAASCNVNGKPLPFSPDWKSYVRADYDIPLDNGLDVELGSDYSWQDKVQYDLSQNPNTIQGAYGIWNASVALADYSQGWRVALLAKNLTDKSYSPLIATGTGYVYRLVPRDDSRYFGVELRKDF